MGKNTVLAHIPVEIECPDEMISATAEVLAGEYETCFSGKDLTVLDIGANVGSFALWAAMRWPGSTIHSYEPHPATFPLLARNVDRMPQVTCYNYAVFPGDNPTEKFWGRYAGDGESALITCASSMFEKLSDGFCFDVPIMHPRNLPPCDVIKLDVEGAEASILEHMNLEQVALILLEYHDKENRDRIKQLLADRFVLLHEDRYSWDLLLPNSTYNGNLQGDCYGRMFFHRITDTKLRLTPLPPHDLTLRQLLSALPGASLNAVTSRLRRMF